MQSERATRAEAGRKIQKAAVAAISGIAHTGARLLYVARAMLVWLF